MATVSKDPTIPASTQGTSQQPLLEKLDSLMSLVKTQNETMASMQKQIQSLVEKQTEQNELQAKCLKIAQSLCPEAKIENMSNVVDLLAVDFKLFFEFMGQNSQNNNLGKMALQNDEYKKAKHHFEKSKAGLDLMLSTPPSKIPFSPLASMFPILASMYESLMQDLIKCDLKLLANDENQIQDAISHIKALQTFNEKQMIEGQVVIDIAKHKALDYKLGLCHFLNNDYTTALPIFKAAHEKNPVHLYTLYGMAYCQEKLGETEAAKEHYQHLSEMIGTANEFSTFSSYRLEIDFELLIAKSSDSYDKNKEAMQAKVNEALKRCDPDFVSMDDNEKAEQIKVVLEDINSLA